MRKILCTISFLILAFILLCGYCKNDNSKELVIYTNIESDFSNKVIEEFNKEYPKIKVKILRASTSVVVSKTCAEKKRPQADVLWGIPASSIVQLDKEKILYPYKPNGIENINKKFIDCTHNIPHWVGVDIWSSVITVNDRGIKNKKLSIPVSYKDLLNKSYNNRISIPNPESSSTGFFILCGIIKTLGEDRAWGFLDRLDENVKKYEYSGSMPIKLVTIGETDLAVGMDFQSLLESNNCDFIKTIFPKEGLFWDMETLSIVNKQHIKPEAKIFLDWAISKKAMNIYSENRAFVSMKGFKSNLKGCPADFSNKLIDMDFYWINKNKQRIIDKWKKRYEFRDR